MKAYNGSKKLKADLLAEARKHEKADKIIQGTYGNSKGWCAVGCTIKSYNTRRDKTFSTSDHSVYETQLGIPRMIARLEDRIFEGMDFKDAKGFPVKFLESITPGADLSKVAPKFFVWLLTDEVDGVIKYAGEDGRIAIQKVAGLYTKTITGSTVSANEWRSAAYDTYDAAYAVDDAAYAVDDAAYAVDAYRIKFYKKMADKLLELLKEAE